MGQREQKPETGKVVPIGQAQDRAPEVQPAVPESERSVLGSIVMNPGWIAPLRTSLRPDDFWREQHRMIFAAMLECSDLHGGLDLSLLIDHLRAAGQLKKVGGMEYVARLAHAVPVAANLWAHVRVVQRASRQRSVIEAATVLANTVAQGAEAPDAVDKFISRMAELDQRAQAADWDDYETAALELYERYSHEADQAVKQLGVRTGLTDLDRNIGGFQPGDFVLIGGREKVGKSFLAVNLARNGAQGGAYVALMGLEMLRRDNHHRLLSLESGIPHDRIRKRELSHQDVADITQAAGRLFGLRLSVFDNRTRLGDIVATAQQLKAAGRLHMLIVDHLQLVDCEGKTLSDKTVAAATRLRHLANELGIVVVAMAQFTKDTNRKPDERPQRDWLFGGAPIKMLPSHILLLHRPDPAVPRAELILDAMRHGQSGAVVPLSFMPEIARFGDWSNR